MGTRGCGLLDVKDVELGQLPMVTETRERSSPVDTAGQLGNCIETHVVLAVVDLQVTYLRVLALTNRLHSETAFQKSSGPCQLAQLAVPWRLP